ncbi:MAG: hypothetical protein QNJ77_06520 [Acidimicrobiia bacterium]|nr:hypothetical protein [Acidimicrobiia bacterium]
MTGRTRIGIRAEDKSPWERRAPLAPSGVRELVNRHGLEVLVEPSERRVFRDEEYRNAGGVVTSDLSAAEVVFGVKEIPPAKLQRRTGYVFFSHVVKGQPYNMPMLQRILELEATLVDYERVVDNQGRRLIFFGRHAGLAGMIDSLWALGQRLDWEETRHVFGKIKPAHAYAALAEAKDAVSEAGKTLARDGVPGSLAPLVVGVAGYGNVAGGVHEILSELPTVELDPSELEDLVGSGTARRDVVYRVTFREEHLVERIEPGQPFELQEYYDHPERYRSRFAPYLGSLTVLMNTIFWTEAYPRLVTRDSVRRLFASEDRPRLRVIGDITCDIEGSIEITERATTPDSPIYVWDCDTGQTRDGVAGAGPVVLAVDALPCELPRESTEDFSRVLTPFVPAIARARWSEPWESVGLPPEIEPAAIVHRGVLTPRYRYLQTHVDAHGGQATPIGEEP